ncbi:hypothetical protein OOJ91_33575 [Micromonospora lupini]|uniref:hypothetical protein n=1 Tax=Micromonospora lupini TaxID=285679 RepID=UPI00224CB9EB|nr:hypothetical protein [Micromonospora lupini]MCX5070777.1 hypothetical protein [Micromonospora lupini]
MVTTTTGEVVDVDTGVTETQAMLIRASVEHDDAAAALHRAREDRARDEQFVAGVAGCDFPQNIKDQAQQALDASNTRVAAAETRFAGAEARMAAVRALVDAMRGHKDLAVHAADLGGMADPAAYGTTSTGASAQGDAQHAASPSGKETKLKDRLRLADRIVLRDGEHVVGSGSVAGSDGELMLGAAVDTPDGRQVHLAAPVYPDDKAAWRGGHAPSQATVVEDGEELTVDTGADVTVVLDAVDAATLPARIDEMIATATAGDKEYRQLLKQSLRLYDEQTRLESQRFPGQGEEKIRLDWQVQQRLTVQGRRRRDYEQVAAKLSPQDRAVYDERQRRIDAAGQDGWEPGREADAAEICGVTPEQFAEITEIERTDGRRQTSDQVKRIEELKYGGGDSLNPILPPLLEQQAALVCGLTPGEYREMEILEAIRPQRRYAYLDGRRMRTDAEQARLDELYAAPAGVTGANLRETHKLRNRYRAGLENHHSGKWDLADARAQQAAMETTAQPLDPAAAAELRRVTADRDAVDQTLDARGGLASATVEISARNGGALVIEAVQEEEEGGVQYRVDRRPADAGEEWSVGYATDPYTTTAAGLRKVGRLAADLATANTADDKPA